MFTLVLHEAPQHLAGGPFFLGVVGEVSGVEDLRALALIKTAEAVDATATLKVEELEYGEGTVCSPFLGQLIGLKES